MRIPKTLQDEWARKLRESGFKDIEVGTGDLLTGSVRSFPDESRTKFATLDTYNANYEYYLAAGALLHYHEFANSEEQQVWALHADGRSIRQISRELGLTFYRVQLTVSRLAAHILNRRGSVEEAS